MFWPSLESRENRGGGNLDAAKYTHIPVLPREVLSYLGCRPGKNYLDLTVGSGGHSQIILEATHPDGQVVGVDRDPEALKRSGERLQTFGRRVKLLYGNLGKISEVLRDAHMESIDGVLIDAGISSDQLEDARRGFSFRSTGPLDMRMDPTSGRTAGEWLRRCTEKELAEAIRKYGEEHRHHRIARAILEARRARQLRTTADLADAIRRAVPRADGSGIDPATRTFQAVRIVVNEELRELEEGLKQLLDLLPRGARVVVISFHSLEDRIAKNLFRAAKNRRRVVLLTEKPVRPSEEEVARNPRCRSAKLRAVEIAGGAA